MRHQRVLDVAAEVLVLAQCGQSARDRQWSVFGQPLNMESQYLGGAGNRIVKRGTNGGATGKVWEADAELPFVLVDQCDNLHMNLLHQSHPACR